MSSSSSSGSNPVVLGKRSSFEMKDLIEHQKEIKTHLKNIEKTIYKYEQSYLDETPGGNVIRGWEGEAKPFNRKGIEPRERVFSNSSHHVFLDYKPIVEELTAEAQIIASNNKTAKASSTTEPKKKKKTRKTKKVAKDVVSGDHEWIPEV